MHLGGETSTQEPSGCPCLAFINVDAESVTVYLQGSDSSCQEL